MLKSSIISSAEKNETIAPLIPFFIDFFSSSIVFLFVALFIFYCDQLTNQNEERMGVPVCSFIPVPSI